MTILAATCWPQVPPERLREVARVAEDSGLAELWLWEDCFWGGGHGRVGAARVDQRLPVGIGVPVPLRNVALAAMETAALHRMFPGRVTVGVGHGVQDWMGQVGVRVDSPLTLLAEYLKALRGLLDRRAADGRRPLREAGRRGARLAAAGAPAAALRGQTGPRTLRLSGQVADGTILDSSATADRAERRPAGPSTEAQAPPASRARTPIVLYLMAVTGPDAARRLAAMERREGTAAVAGDAHAVADAVRSWAAAGADKVVLHPAPDDQDPLAFIRFTAEQVQPLLALRGNARRVTRPRPAGPRTGRSPALRRAP